MIFILHGKVKPAVRMTRRGKWSSPQAQEYLACKMALGLQLRRQMAERGWRMLPAKTPLRAEIHFHFPGGWHNADIDNQAKGIMDSANGIAYHDDRWIDSLWTTRTEGDEYVTTFMVEAME